ncbi:MAG: peroxide stress protein YaaA [Anaerotignum sp.]|nr:peroxide stress protein YaaA [Anaerotignum sp.]
MRIIISPAKKMNIDTDSLAYHDLPPFLNKTEQIYHQLQGMSYEELKSLWKCNDKIAALNQERLNQMDLQKNLTPAILSYEGIQYQHMAPGVFTDREFDYIQKHLRILSGFYGILRPFDGIIPYRLEMQAKLSVADSKDLYDFWGDTLANHLAEETDCILNLASKEYSSCISKHLPKNVRFITCVFGEWKDGKIIEKGTLCKMARGKMVRFLAENQITDPEKAKTFAELQYRYSAEHSDENTYVFLLHGSDQ